MKKGDEIVVKRGGKSFQYLVEKKFIVKPSETWVVRSSNDARLTLLTCYPTYYVGRLRAPGCDCETGHPLLHRSDRRACSLGLTIAAVTIEM